MENINNIVKRWGKFEIKLESGSVGNPFVNVTLCAVFSHEDQKVEVDGFYDGDNIFHIRFMPCLLGEWSYKVSCNRKEMDGAEGKLTCVNQDENNHGYVSAENQYHFAYQDGTPYYPFGTTSYGWAHQRDELAQETLHSLEKSPFNKIRMGVIPHYSQFSAENMRYHPFKGEPPQNWDFSRFQPEYFRMIEKRIEKLMELGIEADLILLHPYADEWGYSDMPHEVDKAYLRYVVSRFAAYRNVWWSLANEYDMMTSKTIEQWDDLCKTVEAADPYHHLLSIHNYQRLYENCQPWITHATVQDGLAVSEEGSALILLKAYHKPVIYDEICYEGNFDLRWGDLSAKELVRRYWNAMISGAYVGHGEVISPNGKKHDMVWTGVGGKLKGESADRIAFMRKIFEEYPGYGWEAVDKWWKTGMAKKDNKYFLIYFGEQIIKEWQFAIPNKDVTLESGAKYRVEIIDTWNMTIEPAGKLYEIGEVKHYSYGDSKGKTVKIPQKPYLALRIIPE